MNTSPVSKELHAVRNHIKNLLAAALLTAISPMTLAQNGPPPAQVVTEESRMLRIAPHARVAGTVVSRHDIRLASEVVGRLTHVVDPGTRAQPGDVLADVDATPTRLRLRETQALMTRAEAQLNFLVKEQSRLERLAENNSAARSQLEQTVADRAAAAADLAAQQARADQLRDEIARSEIRAPFAGIVAERYVQAGERVALGDNVVRLMDAESLEVIARAPLEHMQYIHAGDTITLTDGRRSEPANVRAVISVGNLDVHLFELRIDVPPGTWPAGQTLRAHVPTAEHREVLAVPRDALVLRGDGISIYTVAEDQTARRIMVGTGIADGDWIEISGEGIAPGMRVITRGNERLREGQTVMDGSGTPSQQG